MHSDEVVVTWSQYVVELNGPPMLVLGKVFIGHSRKCHRPLDASCDQVTVLKAIAG